LDTDIVVRLRRAMADLQGVPKVIEGFGMTIEFVQGGTHVVMGVRVAGLYREGCSVVLNSLVEALQALESRGQIVVRLGVIGLQRQGFAHELDALVWFAFLEIGQTKEMQRRKMAWRLPQHSLVRLLSVGKPAGLVCAHGLGHQGIQLCRTCHSA
jgi:hypothetical protein